MTEPCEHYTVSDKPEDQPCYPRAAALLQEEEIKRLQAKVNMLEAENIALQVKIAQYEEGRPMDTAPRDGTSILAEIYTHHGSNWFEILFMSGNVWWSSKCDYPDDDGCYPLRWWPLPGGAK